MRLPRKVLFGWGRFLRAAGACLLLGGLLSTGPALGQEPTRERIATARTTLEQWVETERLISKERRDLSLSREMLNERIELVSTEIDSLRGRITEAEASITEADKRREELIAENDQLKQASASLEDTLISLETGTKELLDRVPAPLRERVRPLSQRLPEDSAESDLSMSQRFQNVVGILNELDKFSREITVASEVRELEDGTSAEVTAIYLGISQGYYVGANNTIAGVGTSTADGWKWIPRNESAPDIAQVLAIMNNEAIASFVRVPLEIE